MNYAQARQVDPKADRPDAGKWRWTVMNDKKVRPHECCSNDEGHNTEEEAQEHYRQYRLDNANYDLRELEGQQLRCLECKAWTQRIVTSGAYKQWILCDDHANRETLEKHLTRSTWETYS